jgi:hypothetical protein
MRPARWPMALSLVTLSLVVASTAILVVTWSIAVPVSWGFRGSSTLFAITAGSVGAVVSIRRPDNRVGWLFVAIGLLFAIESFVNEYTILAVLAVPDKLPGEPEIAWLLTWLWIPPVALALIYLPLVFPTGHLLSPRWRPVAWFGVFAMVLLCAVCAVTPGPIEQATFVVNPFQPWNLRREQVEVVFGLAVLPITVSVVLAITSLVRRFRAADDVARRQIKWFALAATIAGVTDTLYYVSYIVSPSPTITKTLEILVVASLLGLPVAAGLAILRYRLYDIDQIISRTIAYGAVSALLVATYAVAILVLQGPLGSILGGDTISVALSTLVVAALFQPIRQRVQRIVDQRFDRARFDSERTSSAFSERLRGEVDIAAVTTDLDGTVRTALKPTSLGLWLRRGTDG